MRYRQNLRTFAVFLFSLFLTASSLHAQTETGTIRIFVTDQSNAILKGSEVHLIQVDTNIEDHQNVDNDGYATFAPVKPGRYAVLVSHDGFENLRIQDITLDVNQRKLVNAMLHLSSQQSTVVVSNTGQTLQTEEGSLGQVIPGAAAQELPLPQRRYTELPLLSPGVTRSTMSTTSSGTGWFVANGNYHTENNYILDGIDNNQETANAQSLSAQVVQPSPDAIAELKTQTNSYSADIGRGAGAVVNVVLKSGTNALHGSLWYYNRDSALAATSWTAKLSGSPKSDLAWNQFGGTVSGPVRRDKAFFFIDYEGFLDSFSTPYLVTVPTLDERSGKFYRSITNPQTGTPFADNTIPGPQVDELGQKLVNLYPTPNLAGNISSSGQTTSNYGISRSGNEDTQKGDMKVDQYLTSKDIFSYRWSYLRQDVYRNPVFTGLADGQNGTGGQFNTNNNAGFTYTRIITPTIVNVFRAGYIRTYAEFTPASDNDSNAATFGFRNVPNPLNINGIPMISVSNYQALGLDSYTPQHQKPSMVQFLDAVSLTRGTHSIRFGYETRFKKNTFLDSDRTLPQYNFDGSFTGDAIADLMLGQTEQFSAYTQDVVDQRQNYYAAFGQDDWKITPRLTANLGLRYEYATPFYGAGAHKNVNFDFEHDQLLFATDHDRYLTNPDRINFAPRLGVAYQVIPQKMVFRAGYGIFYSGEDIYGSETNLPENPPALVAVTLTRTSGGPSPIKVSDPIPDDVFSKAPQNTLLVHARKANYRTPRAYQFNTALQFQLPGNSSFEMAYVGNRGQHLYGTYQANQTPFGVDGSVPANRPYADRGKVQAGETAANSWYDGLQLRYEKQFHSGWYTLASYTWAHATDEAGAWNVGNSPQYLNDWAAEKAPMDQTSDHRFTIANVYLLPFGRGQRFGAGMNSVENAIFGGWQLSGIVTLQSGLPVNVSLGSTGTNPVTGTRYTFYNRNGGFLRPNRVANISPQTEVDPHKDRLHYLNSAAYAVQTVNTIGNAPRNSAVGPRFANLDMSAKKNVHIAESLSLDFRFEAFNALNNVNFNKPAATFGSPTFGQISGAADPRVIQTAVHFTF